MAFFGLTHLGYQNPIGDRMIENPRGATHPPDGGSGSEAGSPPSHQNQDQQRPLRCPETCSVSQPPPPYSADLHRGSHQRHREMVRRVQTPRSPNQLYTTPLTDNQQYGWRTSTSPEGWTQVRRFPRKNSEMTKFVKEMSAKDREFSLF